MHILKTLKPIRMNGEIVQPGRMVKVLNGEGLIDRGYARQLSQDESQAILSEYVKCAEDLFSKPPKKSPEKKTASVNKNRKAVYQGRLLQTTLWSKDDI